MTSNALTPCLIVFAGMAVVMMSAWATQRALKNAGWIDVFWTYGTGAACVFVALWPSPDLARQWLVAALAAIWSLRLGTFVALRVGGSKHEDVRYANLRKDWGASFNARLFPIVIVQAPASTLLAWSVFAATNASAVPLGLRDALGAATLLLSIAGETLADEQMRRFRAQGKANAVNDSGLWGWSRHPNYFFEWLSWLAYPIIAFDPNNAASYATLVAPALMYVVLRFGTGVPALESAMLKSRGDAFRAYQARVSPFFLLPTKVTPMTLAARAVDLFETAPLPDPVRRAAVSWLVSRTSKQLRANGSMDATQFAEDMRARPIAEHTQQTNEQHYEVPAAFFVASLGPRLKYSCCRYEAPTDTLEQAEIRALSETCANAELTDAQHILELGCGWGSLTLWMAEKYPNARITAVSNSNSQRAFIEARARERRFSNVTILTHDANSFETTARFDRIVSVEMFEHMSNWRALLERCRAWLNPGGKLFIHVFAHKSASYRFDPANRDDWVAQHFFAGGVMPSRSLAHQFGDLFSVEREWWWNGRNYQRTALGWLANFDAHKELIRAEFDQTYGPDAKLWMHRWRLFFLATAGLFGHDKGDEWGVSHFLFKPVRSA